MMLNSLIVLTLLTIIFLVQYHTRGKKYLSKIRLSQITQTKYFCMNWCMEYSSIAAWSRTKASLTG